VTLIDGLIPAIDVHDSPTGKRFAIEFGGRQDSEEEPAHTYGRVVEFEHAPMTPEERADPSKPADGGLPRPNPAWTAKVSDDLMVTMHAAPAESVEVIISIAKPPGSEGLHDAVQRAIALENVQTNEDFERIRGALVQHRKQQVASTVAPVAAAVDAVGGVARPCTIFRCVLATLPAAGIATIAARPDVAGIGPVYETPPASRQDYVLEGAQVKQFVDSGFDGWDRTGLPHVLPTWTVGAGEMFGPDDEHVGFRDDSPGTLLNPVRMNRYKCDGSGCTFVSNFAEGDEHDHPTACTGLILGDLRDGQDANINAHATRVARSGYAGEAWGRIYAGLSDTGRWALALQDAVSGFPVTPLINSSNGGNWDIPGCLGRTTFDHAVNDAFEDGLLVVWAGGNQYGHDDDTCTVEGPKAIGAFKVGTYGNSAWENANDIRTAAISEGDGQATYGSPRGGVSWNEGRNRTILDITGYGNYSTMFSKGGGYGFQSIGGATSQSTATTTGQAADFVHWFKTTYGSVPGPGVLHAALLLMGDRQGESGLLTSKFSNLWGAGRMRMRKLDPAGMDSPYGFGLGSVCVNDGQHVFLPLLQGLPFLDSIDVIKVALYWFDRRVENAPPSGVDKPDDIDLRVERSTLSGWTTLGYSADAYDYKERVRVTPASGWRHRVKISGYNVTSDDAGCGTNSMKVYYAYFYEDSARDDGDGPSASDIAAE
jgi:hypothetical protein